MKDTSYLPHTTKVKVIVADREGLPEALNKIGITNVIDLIQGQDLLFTIIYIGNDKTGLKPPENSLKRAKEDAAIDLAVNIKEHYKNSPTIVLTIDKELNKFLGGLDNRNVKTKR